MGVLVSILLKIIRCPKGCTITLYFVLRTSIINYNMQDTGSVLIQNNVDQRTCGLR